MTTAQAVDAVVKAMAPYIGDTMARSATEAHCQRLGIEGAVISHDQLEALLGKLGGGLNIFVGRDKSASVIAEARTALAALEGSR
ncbi:MAG TPA: hypothetical protein VLF95_10705 [Vicinamibacteria bacterium]|nr:hypothetical protein [Vicinamibacteria bacterium]